MGLLEGKVAIVTGAGQGIGRCEAIDLAKEGAKVVVNDLGGTRDGSGGQQSVADKVVAEIKAMGGQAVANYDSVAAKAGAENIAKTAVDAFGKIDIVVNNAGILRDKTLLKMEESDFDIVMAVHVKGTFLVTQACARIMRQQYEKDNGWKGSIVCTTSVAGLMGNFGQSNYGTAKAGIYGFVRVCSLELQKYGMRVNAIAPIAKTRLTDDLPMFAAIGDELDPSHISPVVVWLASSLASEVNGKIIGVQGNKVHAYVMTATDGIWKDLPARWTPQELAAKVEDIMKL